MPMGDCLDCQLSWEGNNPNMAAPFHGRALDSWTVEERRERAEQKHTGVGKAHSALGSILEVTAHTQRAVTWNYKSNKSPPPCVIFGRIMSQQQK